MLAAAVEPTIIMDVGANTGQSVRRFKRLFPTSVIHAFEPSPVTFASLRDEATRHENVVANQMAVGNQIDPRLLYENEDSFMSSLLTQGAECWGSITRTIEVPMITIDRYCELHSIPRVTLLKTDTQGFDLEVIKGCRSIIEAGRLEMVLSEVNFADLYQGGAEPEDVFRWLRQHGMKVVAIYEQYFLHGYLGWMDVLFRNARLPVNPRVPSLQ